MILDSGISLRICRAASIPFRIGRPMSNRIKSGLNSPAFRTASSPSESSQMICRSPLVASVVEMNCRKGAKSSTRRTRTDDTRARSSFSKVSAILRRDVPVFVPTPLLLCPSPHSIEFPRDVSLVIVPGKRGVGTVPYQARRHTSKLGF